MGLTVEALFHVWGRARADVAKLQRRLRDAGGEHALRLNEAMEEKLRTMNMIEGQIIAQPVRKDDAIYLLTMAVQSKRAELMDGQGIGPNWELVIKAMEGLETRRQDLN